MSRRKHHKTAPGFVLGQCFHANMTASHVSSLFLPPPDSSHFSNCQETDFAAVWKESEENKNIYAGWRERETYFQI